MQHYFEIVLLIYGFAFFALSIVVYALPKEEPRSSLLQNLYLIALFGILQGSHEFIELEVLNGTISSVSLNGISKGLGLLAYLPLVEFGRRIFYKKERSFFWSIPLLYGGMSCAVIGVVFLENTVFNGLDVASQLLIGFPGTVLAGLVMFNYGGKSGVGDLKYSLRVTGTGFMAYAVLILVLPNFNSLFTGILPNETAFLAFIHIPVQIIRTLAILTISTSLIYVVRGFTIYNRQRELDAISQMSDAREHNIKKGTEKIQQLAKRLRLDVEERKVLEAQKEQFFKFFNLARDLQCIASFDGFFKQVNPAFSKILGYSKDELLAIPFIQLILPEDRDATLGIIEKQLHSESEVILDFENRFVCKNGSICWLSWKAIFEPVEKLMYAAARDVTELKKNEEEIKRLSDSELNKAKLEAEKANLAKSDFLSSMSHELRTPMNAVLGFGQLLESEDLTEDQHDSVQEILTAGRHLLSLINQVLDLSKIESGSLEVKKEKVDLNKTVQSCLELLQPSIHKNSIRIIDKITSADAITVIADSLHLKQVLLNLISNAIKYNRSSGSVALYCERINSGKLRINVADTGNGLSSEEISKLFQAFERLSAQNSNIEGTGIGLYISKKLIEGMKGTIGVNSSVGMGSCFWIEIPLG